MVVPVRPRLLSVRVVDIRHAVQEAMMTQLIWRKINFIVADIGTMQQGVSVRSESLANSSAVCIRDVCFPRALVRCPNNQLRLFVRKQTEESCKSAGDRLMKSQASKNLSHELCVGIWSRFLGLID